MQSPRGGECGEEAHEGTETRQEDSEVEGGHVPRCTRVRVPRARLQQPVKEVQGGGERQPAVHDGHCDPAQGLQRDCCGGR